LLSLSESVSIAGNPGRGTSRHLAPSQVEISQRAGLPLYTENKQVSRLPGAGGWAGLRRGRLEGGGEGSQLALPGGGPHPPSLPLLFLLADQDLEGTWAALLCRVQKAQASVCSAGP
jgi:hypothetical protein